MCSHLRFDLVKKLAKGSKSLGMCSTCVACVNFIFRKCNAFGIGFHIKVHHSAKGWHASLWPSKLAHANSWKWVTLMYDCDQVGQCNVCRPMAYWLWVIGDDQLEHPNMGSSFIRTPHLEGFLALVKHTNFWNLLCNRIFQNNPIEQVLFQLWVRYELWILILFHVSKAFII